MLPFVSEADRFLPSAAGVHLSGINAATLAAQQGGLAGSASDYMRLAMPVRDPDNGDAISGSGEFLLFLGYRIVKILNLLYHSFMYSLVTLLSTIYRQSLVKNQIFKPQNR